MLKHEGVVIHISDSLLQKMTVLVGSIDSISNKPVEIFNEYRVEFLSQLSRRLLTNPACKALPDVVTFAFWCRQSNLRRMRSFYAQDDRLKVGLGLTFHICPANVPINFAFSMAFGLLSGNTCVIRLPSKSSASVDLLIHEVKAQLNDFKLVDFQQNLVLIRFDRDEDLSRFWMSVADGRVVWGGDDTVMHMRTFPSKPRSREVAFSDRYSLCALNPESILQMDELIFKQFSNHLFNDIYLMDQAACSSPQLIVWIGEKNAVQQAKSRLWPEVISIANAKYSLEAVHAMDKFVKACRSALTDVHVQVIERHENMLYRMALSSVDQHQDELRGHFGSIYEVTLPDLEALAPIVNERYQTLTIHGIDPSFVRQWIIRHRLRGIDRVVPIGRALDMSIVWDGYDLISSLSRVIDV